MNKNTNLFERALSTRFSAQSPLLLICLGVFISLPARGAGANGEPDSQKSSSPASLSPQGEIPVPSASAPKPSSADSKPVKTDAASLVGKAAGEVESTLGKPTGRLQTAQGALWLYADWRIQFDHQNLVLNVERDQPLRLAKLDPQFVAAAEATDKAAAARAAADDVARIKANAPKIEKLRILSNGGQEVDLAPLLVGGQVTIVDFYADWCDPCRRLSPRLEQLAKDNPDVFLLKVDIVNWGTPVVKQFDLHSIPNVRVFGRDKQMVGSPESDFKTVLGHVEAAKIAEFHLSEELRRQPRIPAPTALLK